MLKKVLIALAVIIVGVVVVAQMQPAEFAVTRSAVIAASADKVFPHVNDLRKWEAWSPFNRLDPNMKRAYMGPESGTGAKMNWEGNTAAGAGTVSVTSSTPNEAVALDLDMTKPMNAHNLVQFTFKPDAQGTQVTWSMQGTANFFGKIIHLFMNMDKMVGGQFDEGLANLKKVVEASK